MLWRKQALRSASIESALGLDAGDWAWLEQRTNSAGLRVGRLRSETPLEVERAWRALLGALAREWPRLAEGERERALAIAARAPRWG